VNVSGSNVKERGGPYELPKRNSLDIGQAGNQAVFEANAKT